ncbi:MAG: hypothetical protein WBR56_01580, partial [Sedimenticolaceae bacterium]
QQQCGDWSRFTVLIILISQRLWINPTFRKKTADSPGASCTQVQSSSSTSAGPAALVGAKSV